MSLEKPQECEIDYEGRLAYYAKTYGWCLCVGAGISRGLFDDWNDLAESLVRAALPKIDPAEIKEFSRDNRPESLIQAAVNLGQGKSNKEILEKLSETFYSKVKQKAGSEWRVIAKALTASRPSSLEFNEWRVFLDFIESYKGLSSPGLAEVIVEAMERDRAPSSIISFNAEPVLYALINGHYAIRNPKKAKIKKNKILDRLSNDLSRPQRGRVPYYYVHGLLPVRRDDLDLIAASQPIS